MRIIYLDEIDAGELSCIKTACNCFSVASYKSGSGTVVRAGSSFPGPNGSLRSDSEKERARCAQKTMKANESHPRTLAIFSLSSEWFSKSSVWEERGFLTLRSNEEALYHPLYKITLSVSPKPFKLRHRLISFFARRSSAIYFEPPLIQEKNS
jgi:hypothetical protein